MTSRRLAVALITALAALPLQARVNSLEPWSPGFDAGLPTRSWSSDLNVFVGRGARSVDRTDLSYVVSVPVRSRWEVGAAWGLAAIDGPGAQSDSGLSDLTVAAKYRLSEAAVAAPAKVVTEFGLSLPTGDPDEGLGAGGIGLFGGGGVTYPLGAVQAHAQAGLRLYTPGSDTHWGRVVSLTLGATHRVDPEWTVGGDLRILDHGRDKINGVRAAEGANEVYLAPGGTWAPPNAPLALQGAVLFGLSRDAYDFGLLIGAKF